MESTLPARLARGKRDADEQTERDMSVPADPKIYHIIHVDRLPFVITDGGLLCDAAIARREPIGTTIGMNDIKQRRLAELRLDSHPDLHVGEFVPFYFCPRSVMLYVISRANHPQLSYQGGQAPIVHLEMEICGRPLLGLKSTIYAGRSRFRMPVPATSKTGLIWRNWMRSTGTPWKPGIGRTARRANRRSS